MAPLKPLKIATLINTDESHYITLFKKSYLTIFTTLSPTSTITFWDPVTTQSRPKPANYDLLIIGGGTYVVEETTPWVLNELSFLKTTVRDFPKLKIVAICFGHQKFCQAFGGTLDFNKSGSPELGVTKIVLTPEGQKFFPFAAETGALNLHELHRKEISTAALGLLELAENNQCCLSESGMILTFQGHPEMSEELARALMEANSMSTEGLTEEERMGLVDGTKVGHDGVEIWRRVLEWVGE